MAHTVSAANSVETASILTSQPANKRLKLKPTTSSTKFTFQFFFKVVQCPCQSTCKTYVTKTVDSTTESHRSVHWIVALKKLDKVHISYFHFTRCISEEMSWIEKWHQPSDSHTWRDVSGHVHTRLKHLNSIIHQLHSFNMQASVMASSKMKKKKRERILSKRYRDRKREE